MPQLFSQTRISFESFRVDKIPEIIIRVGQCGSNLFPVTS